MLRFLIFTTFLSMTIFTNAFAVEKQAVPESKHTRSHQYLTSEEAYAVLQSEGQQILFLDVRTRAEVSVLGMPTVADANVPYMKIDEPMTWNDDWGNFKMTRNPEFLDGVKQRLVQKGLTQGDKVFLMCRSGSRSAYAADLLTEAGFTNVYSVVDGFEGDKAKDGQRTINGWKNSKLPWSYKLDKKKMYLPE